MKAFLQLCAFAAVCAIGFLPAPFLKQALNAFGYI